MRYTPWLTTLDDVRAHRRLGASETSDDELLKRLIGAASAEFARQIGRVPMPYRATRRYDADGANVEPYTLDLDADLLELTALTNGDGSAIGLEQVALRPTNDYPKWRIALKQGAGVTFTYGGDPQEAIAVEGWWGYVPHYESAWRVCDTIGGDGLAADGGTLVASAVGFEIGHYLRLDDEIVQVIDRNEATLEVTRGELGTTRADHAAGTAIYVFEPLPDIRAAVREMVAYSYKAIDRIGGRVQVYDGGRMTVDDLDPLVRGIVHDHARKAMVVIR